MAGSGDDVELQVEAREPLLDVAAFLVFLRLIGCGFNQAIRLAREAGFLATARIVRQHRSLLVDNGLIVYYGKRICITEVGARIVDRCNGDVECVYRMLLELEK